MSVSWRCSLAASGSVVLDPSIVTGLLDRRDGVSVDDLTTREIDVLEQIARELSNGAIATALNVSVKAVEKNITTIFRKLGIAEQTLVDRRVTAALTYLRAQVSPSSREQPGVAR